MTWGSIGAFAGLGLLALPIIIHLLGRDPARRQRFPSLRFVPSTRLLPTRWSHVHDWPLLLLRLLLVATAVSALARPSIPTTATRSAATSRLVRVVLLDTTGHPVSADAGRRWLDSAAAGTIVRTSDPVAEFSAAAELLRQEGGRGEVVIVSDFGSDRFRAEFDQLLPAEIGITTVRWAEVVDAGRTAGGRDRTDVSGIAGGRATDDSTSVDARLIALDEPERAPLLRSARGVTSRAGLGLVERLREPFVGLPVAAPSGVAPTRAPPTAPGAEAIPVARFDGGEPAAFALEDSVRGGVRVLVFTNTTAADFETERFASALSVARQVPRRGAAVPPAMLAWDRAPSESVASASSASSAGTTASLARWLWAAVLVLMAAEWQLRRRTKVPHAEWENADA